MTDRKEIEALVIKMRAKGDLVDVKLDKDGYIDTVLWNGQYWTPLSFVERARAKV